MWLVLLIEKIGVKSYPMLAKNVCCAITTCYQRCPRFGIFRTKPENVKNSTREKTKHQKHLIHFHLKLHVNNAWVLRESQNRINKYQSRTNRIRVFFCEFWSFRRLNSSLLNGTRPNGFQKENRTLGWG